MYDDYHQHFIFASSCSKLWISGYWKIKWKLLWYIGNGVIARSLHDGKGGILKSRSPSQVLAKLCGGVVSGPVNKLSIAGDPSGSQFGEKFALFVPIIINPFSQQFALLQTHSLIRPQHSQY